MSPRGTSMEFSIKRFVLRLLFEKAALVVPLADPTVLKNFQLDAQPDQLRVIASDLELSMIATTELVATTTSGTAVFPARKMLDIVSNATDDEIHIRVTAGTANITVGRTTWNLKLQSGADYPAMPQTTDIALTSVDRQAFATALHAVRYAACKDAERASLMMIDIAGGHMTACDGSRFQQAAINDIGFNFRIPIGAVDDLIKLLRGCDLPTIAIGESPHHLIFSFGADVFIVNKLLAAFPNMEAALLRPALENKYRLAVDRAELTDAIKRVRITADPETSAIALILTDGALTVSARDKYGNAAYETLDAVWRHGERTQIVNHAFLTDMIKSCPGQTLHFQLGDDTATRKAPLMLRDDDTGTVGVLQQMCGDWVTGS